jgi:hypothetical protein
VDRVAAELAGWAIGGGAGHVERAGVHGGLVVGEQRVGANVDVAQRASYARRARLPQRQSSGEAVERHGVRRRTVVIRPSGRRHIFCANSAPVSAGGAGAAGDQAGWRGRGQAVRIGCDGDVAVAANDHVHSRPLAVGPLREAVDGRAVDQDAPVERGNGRAAVGDPVEREDRLAPTLQQVRQPRIHRGQMTQFRSLAARAISCRTNKDAPLTNVTVSAMASSRRSSSRSRSRSSSGSGGSGGSAASGRSHYVRSGARGGTPSAPVGSPTDEHTDCVWYVTDGKREASDFRHLLFGEWEGWALVNGATALSRLVADDVLAMLLNVVAKPGTLERRVDHL